MKRDLMAEAGSLPTLLSVVDGRLIDQEGFERLLLVPAAHERRVQWCRTAATGFGEAGYAVWVAGWIEQDDRLTALGTVLQMASDLAQGAVTLLDGDRHYATAALVRQFVECEYLVWLFGEQPDEAAQWLHAAPADRQRLFRPAAMRKRSKGRFRSEEYASHCEPGGHPNPVGAFMLPGRRDSRQLAEGRWQWVDLGQHLERCWDLAVLALRVHNLVEMPPVELMRRLEDARDQWHGHDQLAVRFARLSSAGNRRVAELV